MRTAKLAAVTLLGMSLVAGCGKPGDTHWLTDPGIANHAVYLPLSGTPHDPSAPNATISCERCHPSTTFKVFDCTTCHTPAICDPYHGGVASYPAPGTAASADCYRCHPKGEGTMSPADHAPYFAIGTASHPAICTQCHTDVLNRQDPSTLACVTCHAGLSTFATSHASVKDYPLTPSPPWCLRCHADDAVNPIASHGKQPGPAGSAGPGDGHHDTHCFQCHTMVPPLAPFSGPGPGIAGRPWAEDWSVATCSKCH